MSNEIKDMIGQCSACNEYQHSQCKEPLMTHEIPERPWSRVAMDIFSLEGEDHLITVDFYSDFWEVDKLSDMTSKTVIDHSKVHFSRYGVPDVVVTDNGGQFDSDEFRRFARDWEFNHVTTSPYHSQSNGKVESAVKIANRKFLRTTQEQTEPEVLESAEPDLPDAPLEETVRIKTVTYGNPGPEVPENPETLHLGPERRTRTRVVKRPSRFNDYV